MDRDPYERWHDRVIAVALTVLVVGITLAILSIMFTW